MEIIPAIDLREGQSIRLLGEEAEQVAIYHDDVLEQVLAFKEAGAKWVHITDLDGAFSGRLGNLKIIQELVDKNNVNIQFSGGIRTKNDIETVLGIGVDRISLGTAAIRDANLVRWACQKYGSKIALGLDSRDGLVALEGYESPVGKTADKLIAEMKDCGVEYLIYTDIRRDGSMKGPNLEAIEKVIKNSGMKVIVCGGIDSLACVQKLCDFQAAGAVIGKAIYMGAINLPEAIALANR